jgi:hypothetical protein
MNAHVLNIARKYFNPRTWRSGTEQMAPMLYAMIRMTRPRAVVEYGSGYSTLFILQALADSVEDFTAERADLLQKTRTSEILHRDAATLSWKDAAVREWFTGGDRASAVDPTYYLESYLPHLYCFENHPVEHAYVAALQGAVAEAGLGQWFSLHDGAITSADALPAAAKPVDLVWWDHPGFNRCFRLFWPVLNPNGGTIVFHDVASGIGTINWESYRQLIDRRREDLEAVVLCQPNKLDQNSCAIVRRTTTFTPPFTQAALGAQLRSARALVNGGRHD